MENGAILKLKRFLFHSAPASKRDSGASTTLVVDTRRQWSKVRLRGLPRAKNLPGPESPCLCDSPLGEIYIGPAVGCARVAIAVSARDPDTSGGGAAKPVATSECFPAAMPRA